MNCAGRWVAEFSLKLARSDRCARQLRRRERHRHPAQGEEILPAVSSPPRPRPAPSRMCRTGHLLGLEPATAGACVARAGPVRLNQPHPRSQSVAPDSRASRKDAAQRRQGAGSPSPAPSRARRAPAGRTAPGSCAPPDDCKQRYDGRRGRLGPVCPSGIFSLLTYPFPSERLAGDAPSRPSRSVEDGS